jgi:hypothetical protein
MESISDVWRLRAADLVLADERISERIQIGLLEPVFELHAVDRDTESLVLERACGFCDRFDLLLRAKHLGKMHKKQRRVS